MVKKLKTKKEENVENQPRVESFTPDPKKGLDAQKFLDYVLKIVNMMINDALMGIKRDIHDIKINQKILKNRVMDLELEYQSLGMALGHLGIVEINTLNKTKNMIREKLSIVGKKGIRGRVDVSRYNIKPVSDDLKIKLETKQEHKQ